LFGLLHKILSWKMNKLHPTTATNMKLALLITLIALTLINTTGQAQITNEELKKYIITMDSIETLKNQLTVSMNNLSKGNNKISAERYNTLIPIISSEAKLTESKATAEEIAYVKKTVALRDEELRKFQNASQSLINNYMGTETFTKVRNSLKSDATLKKKYDSLTVKPIRP
jgi:predicted Zn-dependent protease